MKKYELYLFDFDGTLFDTFPALNYVFKVSFKEVGINVTDEMIPWLSRVPLSESYETLGAPNDKEIIAKFIDKINESLDSEECIRLTKPFKETFELFDYIKRNNLKMGVVTSNNSGHVKDVLSHFGIDSNDFVTIIGNEESVKIKPDPTPILVALKESGYLYKKDKVVYIGDSFNDYYCAKNANVDAILLDRDNSSDKDFKKISHLMELFE